MIPARLLGWFERWHGWVRQYRVLYILFWQIPRQIVRRLGLIVSKIEHGAIVTRVRVWGWNIREGGKRWTLRLVRYVRRLPHYSHEAFWLIFYWLLFDLLVWRQNWRERAQRASGK